MLHGGTADDEYQQERQPQEGCHVPPLSLPFSSTLQHQKQNHDTNKQIEALLFMTSSLHPRHRQSSSATSSLLSAQHALSQPGSSLLSRPFRCPNPNCNRSYKQANGLKYHVTHGTCNVSISYVKDLEERRKRQGMSSTDQHHQLTTSPSAPTTSSSFASSSSAPSSLFTRTSPPLQSSIEQNDHLLLPSAIPTYSDLSKLSEHDPQVEAECRLYRCGLGDCQKRLV